MSKGGAAKNCPAALGSEHLRQLRTLTWRHRCKAGLTRRVFVRFFLRRRCASCSGHLCNVAIGAGEHGAIWTQLS